MAQRTLTTLVDDLDGTDATQTVTFALRGTTYEIDLTDEHATALEESLAEWITAARKTTARTTPARSTARASSTPKRGDLDAVRTWARDNGHSVAERGRIKQAVIDAYDNR